MKRAIPLVLAAFAILAAAWTVSLNVSLARATQFPDPIPTHENSAGYDPEAVNLPGFHPEPGSAVLVRDIDLRTMKPARSRVEILRYTVQTGDSVFGIAKRYGVEPETILWGNYETLDDDPHLLRPGQELNILPVDGTYYQWQAGDELSKVADFFGVQPEDITAWPGNQLDPANPQIEPGQWLIVPGGIRAFKQWFVPTIARGQAGVGHEAAEGLIQWLR